jgi:hypothetical protein
MADPIVTISWGELFDRLSILEIKQERLSSESLRATVDAQLSRLTLIARSVDASSQKLSELRTRLKSVNERLWTIEDEIRAHEARAAFDARFIGLARSVYHNNDERNRLKRAIDELLGSESEPKAYAPYTEHKSAPS